MQPECDPFFLRFNPEISVPLIADAGPLAGLRAAVKDNYDIAGFVTGNGCPEWAASHPPAMQTAPLIQRLLDAGLTLAGKAQMDEMAYSLMGVNARYGTPRNAAAPDRVPGGSSSGSAVLVASGALDIGIGSDTGGSVRIPAAFNGVIGLRPTHGHLPCTGLIPFAPSYDTPGFFTRDLALMETLWRVVDPIAAPARTLGRLWAPADLWDIAEPETAQTLRSYLGERIADDKIDTRPLLLGDDLMAWFECFRVHQAYEIWKTLGDWVTVQNPAFGPGIAERFKMASAITSASFSAAVTMRATIVAKLAQFIDPQTCLILPSAPAAAPLRSADGAALDQFRTAAICLLCIAGHGGLPQLSLPAGRVADGPVGLSLVGARHSERALIATAAHWGLA
ncbi:MAG: amidase [Alphaproteobacteria bacterium]|nr:amidase [Alphaproteobacteria bacterium]